MDPARDSLDLQQQLRINTQYAADFGAIGVPPSEDLARVSQASCHALESIEANSSFSRDPILQLYDTFWCPAFLLWHYSRATLQYVTQQSFGLLAMGIGD